ncbi:hypothetical protein BZG24_30720, partial [Escherichia coli]|nr:hypothetical protein [Escherichia coli]
PDYSFRPPGNMLSRWLFCSLKPYSAIFISFTMHSCSVFFHNRGIGVSSDMDLDEEEAVT